MEHLVQRLPDRGCPLHLEGPGRGEMCRFHNAPDREDKDAGAEAVQACKGRLGTRRTFG